MRDEITSGYDSIPLHPDSESLWMFAELKEGWKDQLEGKEVQFEIVMDKPDHRYSQTPYAKIIVEEKEYHQGIYQQDMENKEGIVKLGVIDDVDIYYDKHHPDQSLTVDYDEKNGIMKYIIGPYDDISVYDGIKKTVRISGTPSNMIKEL